MKFKKNDRLWKNRLKKINFLCHIQNKPCVQHSVPSRASLIFCIRFNLTYSKYIRNFFMAEWYNKKVFHFYFLLSFVPIFDCHSSQAQSLVCRSDLAFVSYLLIPTSSSSPSLLFHGAYEAAVHTKQIWLEIGKSFYIKIWKVFHSIEARYTRKIRKIIKL